MNVPPGLGTTDSIVNLEEVIARMVGNQKPVPPQERYEQLMRQARALTGGKTALPRGVYRFATHEQADAWEMKHILKAASR